MGLKAGFSGALQTEYADIETMYTKLKIAAKVQEGLRVPVFKKLADSATVWKTDIGGFDSVYGLGLSLTRRYENTFSNPGITAGNLKAGKTETKVVTNTPVTSKTGTTPSSIFKVFTNPYKQKFNPFDSITPDVEHKNTYENSVPFPPDDRRDNFGLSKLKDKFNVDKPDKHTSGVRSEFNKQKINPFKTDDDGKKYNGLAGNVAESKEDVSVPTDDLLEKHIQ